MWTEGMFPSFGLLCFDDMKWTFFSLLGVAIISYVEMCFIYNRSKQDARMCFISVSCKFDVLESPFLRWSIYSCGSYQNQHLASWATSLPGSLHVVWNCIFNLFSIWVTDISTGHHRKRDSHHYFVCVSVVFWDILCPPQLDQLIFLCFIGWFYILV